MAEPTGNSTSPVRITPPGTVPADVLAGTLKIISERAEARTKLRNCAYRVFDELSREVSSDTLAAADAWQLQIGMLAADLREELPLGADLALGTRCPVNIEPDDFVRTIADLLDHAATFRELDLRKRELDRIKNDPNLVDNPFRHQLGTPLTEQESRRWFESRRWINSFLAGPGGILHSSRERLAEFQETFRRVVLALIAREIQPIDLQPSESHPNEASPAAVVMVGMEKGSALPVVAQSAESTGPDITCMQAVSNNLPSPKTRQKFTRDEADNLVKDYLAKHAEQAKNSPDLIKVKAISEDTGVAGSSIVRTPFWIAFASMRRTRKEHKSPELRVLPLSDKMLASIPDSAADTPAEIAAQKEIDRQRNIEELTKDQERDQENDDLPYEKRRLSRRDP